MIRRAWTADDEALLRRLYPDWPAAGLVHVMGRTVAAIRQRALLLGIGKSAAYLAANARGQFRPGLVPHNKGLRRLAVYSTAATFRSRIDQKNTKETLENPCV